MDGIQVCEKIKEIGKINNSFIMFLTARGEDYTQLAVFDAGADDFVTKPINPKILLKRVEALLSRKKKNDNNTDENSDIVQVGNLSLNQDKYQIIYNNTIIDFPRKEFRLLELLITKPDKVFKREEIFDIIWKDTFVGDRTIDVHIRKIREKLGEKSITTIKGIGYKLNTSFFE